MNAKYGTFEEALNHDDGLAVLGVFVDVRTATPSAVSVCVNFSFFALPGGRRTRRAEETDRRPVADQVQKSDRRAAPRLGHGSTVAR